MCLLSMRLRRIVRMFLRVYRCVVEFGCSMACFSPIQAFYAREKTATGKRSIVFQRSASATGLSIRLPCGKCVGCLLERSRQWAMRCLHEKKMSQDSCFITLTYDDAFLPPGGTLVLRDLQLFMKRLRKAKGNGVRFYACGEYGDSNYRPHYHVLLFNCRFPDMKKVGENGRKEPLYQSDELGLIWDKGFNVIGEVTFDSAAYVARYVLKKQFGSKCPTEVVDAYGIIYDRLPEFTVMSRRPGIGASYYEKYGKEVYDHDSVIINGREVRPARFYDCRFELANPEKFANIKRRRKKMAFLMKNDNTVDRRRVKEIIALKRLKQLERVV